MEEINTPQESDTQEVAAGETPIEALDRIIKGQLGDEEIIDNSPEQEESVELDTQSSEESESEPYKDVPGWVPKRIDKLTRKRKEAEEREREALEEVERLRQELKTGSQPKTENANPVESFETMEELDKFEADTKAFQRWANRLSVKYKRDPDAVEQELAETMGEGKMPDDVELFLEEASLNAIDTLEDVIPNKRRLLSKRSKYLDAATKALPWMADPGSPQRKKIDEWMLSNPALRQVPEAPLFLGYALVGMAAVQKQQAPSGGTPEPTAQPKAPASSPHSKPRNQTAYDEAKTRALKKGDMASANQFMKAALNNLK